MCHELIENVADERVLHRPLKYLSEIEIFVAVDVVAEPIGLPECPQMRRDVQYSPVNLDRIDLKCGMSNILVITAPSLSSPSSTTTYVCRVYLDCTSGERLIVNS